LKKPAPAVARKGTISSGCELEDLRVQECVNRRFSTEEPGFALLIVASRLSQQKHSYASTNKSSESDI
jgi:hypothetical protein